MSQIQTVQFHGDQLQAVQQDGKVWVVLKRACEALGIDPNAQGQRLRDPERSPWATTCLTHAVADDGRSRELLCLDIESLPMWLATIDTARVRPDLRAKLATYQRECAQVLRDHFFAEPKLPALPPIPSQEDLLRGWLTQIEQNKQLEAANLTLRSELSETIDTLAPKAEVYDEFMLLGEDMSVEDFAKLCGTTRQRMFAWLREEGVIFKHKVTPTVDATRRGLATEKVKKWAKPSGEEVYYAQCRITPKGVAELGIRFREEERKDELLGLALDRDFGPELN